MATFEHFIKPLPALPEGGDELNQLMRRAETVTEPDPKLQAALAKQAGAGPRILERVLQLAASLGPLDELDRKDAAVHEAVGNAMPPRLRALFALAPALAEHFSPEVEAELLRIFLAHPASRVRHPAGDALLTRASVATLQKMAAVMEDENPPMVWVRNVGTEAAVRLDPATAYDRLHRRFEKEPVDEGSYFARGLFNALGRSAPIDPRWFPFMVRFYVGRDAVVVDSVLKAHPVPEAVAAVAELVKGNAVAGKDWSSYAGFTLQHWAERGKAAAPAVVQAVGAALRAGWSDHRLTGPLDVLVGMKEPSVAPALRELQPLAKRKAKTALAHVLESLDPGGGAPAKKGKRKGTADPEREALAKVLAGAGLAAGRAEELAGLARNRIVITPEAGKRSGLGESRFGGLPDLPPGTEWPAVRYTQAEAKKHLTQGLDATPHLVDGKQVVVPLAFVAQLRLEELAPHDKDGKLPAKGLLSFFTRFDLQPGSHGELFRCASHVVLSKGKLTQVLPPPELPEYLVYPACPLKLAHELPLPPPVFARSLGLLQEESRLYDELYGKHERSSSFGALGHALAAYYKGLPGRGQTLLLQLASGGATEFIWGDESSIFFLIADAALKAGDLSEAVCVADEL